MKDKVLNFLTTKSPKLCVVSTASKAGKVEAAVVGYGVADDLTIIIDTHRGSQRYRNIGESPQIAIVFGISFTEPNVQYDGEATLVEGGEEYTHLEDFFFTQNPKAMQFKGPELVFVKIKPKHIKYQDFSTTPPVHEEENF